MSMKLNLAPLMTLDRVESAYVGTLGCMCGCNGDYAYRSETQAEAGANRGYEVTDDEVSDRKVKGRFNKLLKQLAEGDYDVVHVEDYGVFVERGNRQVAVYFRKAA